MIAQPEQPGLRLFAADAPAQPIQEAPPPRRPRRRITLQRAFEKWVLPDMLGDNRAASTIAEDLNNITRFSRLWRLMNPRTMNPGVPLREVTRDTLIEARNLMQAGITSRSGEPLAPDTIRKCLTTVRKVMRAAQDRGKLDRVPQLPEIRRSESEPVPIELDQIERLYRAADAAEWPQIGSIEPATTWRCWLVWFWVYGARTQDFVAYKSCRQVGLRWSSIRREKRCPIAKLRIDCPHGWLRYRPQKTQRTRGESLVLPLHPVALAHLQPFEGLDPERVWPNGRSKQSFYSAWRAIVRRSGLPSDVTIAGENSPSLRKGCSNNWDDVRDGLGERVLGHVAQGTNGRHYKQVLPHLVAGIERLELPPSSLIVPPLP